MSPNDEFPVASNDSIERGFQIPRELPILPLENIVFYPSMIAPLQVRGKTSIEMIDAVLAVDKMMALVAQRNKGVEEPKFDDLYSVGTAAITLKMLKTPDGSIMVLMQGLSRIRVTEPTSATPYLVGKVEIIEEPLQKSQRVDALQRNLANQFQKMIALVPHLPDELKLTVMNIEEPGKLADMVASHIRLSLEERQQILETVDIAERLERVTAMVGKELAVIELGGKIQEQVNTELSRKQREYYLREEMKAIQRELGDGDRESLEVEELKTRISEANLPEAALREATREVDRLEQMSPGSAEYTVSRTYLDWILMLPWSVLTEDKLNIKEAQKVLNDDHYGLEKIKERILEYLAVRKLKKDIKGPILCFVGPPGVGKTSLGRSIARAIGRKFVRMSLGGMRDEAEIRGHRRTYIGALPGKIIQGLRTAGSRNPVFMLDEIDKVGADFRGDPSSALLEVLDPEQNFSFSDHYLDIPFDLSQVMFIATANILDPVPPALRDRMEVLELSGYSTEEKIQIAKRFLIPKQLDAHGLGKGRLNFDEQSVGGIIGDYTREAGLRNLEREIANICRKVARQVAEGKKTRPTISRRSLSSYLGPLRFLSEVAHRDHHPGVVTGLAWTPTGGDIIFIETILMKGKGILQLTGQLGDVMKESAQAALSYIRSSAARFKIDDRVFSENDIHIHVPAGAIPKDGPSAGLALAIALFSLLTKGKVRGDVAMTGEITLQGRVLPIGGLKEKLLAARRAGIKTVIIPAQNKKDLGEVNPEVLADLTIHAVNVFDDAAKIIFPERFEKRNSSRKKT
jgi:ATP-dependent Lon protease